jgi:hypothetical protein
MTAGKTWFPPAHLTGGIKDRPALALSNSEAVLRDLKSWHSPGNVGLVP